VCGAAGATIHTTNGLWMNVQPRQNAPPTPPPRTQQAAAAGQAAHSEAAAAAGCPMHAAAEAEPATVGV